MADQASPKLNRINTFILSSLILASLLCCMQMQIYTGETLAETVVFTAAIVFLVVKFYSSKIILLYRNVSYTPSKATTKAHYIFTGLAVSVILPLCLNLVIACLFLIAIKYIPFFNAKFLARTVNSIYQFNSEHFRFPLWIAGFVIAVLAMTEYISAKFYKKYKKVIKLITSPLKVMAILILFFSEDQGIENKTIQFAVHDKPVKAEKITFQASEQLKEKIAEAFGIFTNIVVSDIDKKRDDQKDNYLDKDAADEEWISKILHRTSRLLQQPGYVRNFDFSSGPAYTQEEQTILSAAYKVPVEETPAVNSYFESTNFYNTVNSKNESFFDNLITILNDDKKTLKPVNETTSESILKQYLQELLAKTYLFDKLPQHISFPGFLNFDIFKNKVFDFIKQEMVNSFFYLINEKNISIQKIKALTGSMKKYMSAKLNDAVSVVQDQASLLKRYYNDIQDRLFTQKTTKADLLDPGTAITYEEGLKIKNEYIKEEKSDEELQLIREDLRNRLLKENPGLSEDELETLVEENIPSVKEQVDKDISLNQDILDQKKYYDFDFIRDQFTGGGIFFGKSLVSSASQLKFDWKQNYYPAADNKDSVFLFNPSRVWLERKNGKLQLFIKASQGNFHYEGYFDSLLFVTAYRYIFEHGTYPVLIDIFNEVKSGKYTGRQVPSYHKSLVHNAALKDLFLQQIISFLMCLIKK